MMILFIQCNIAIRAMSWNKNKSSYGGLHCNSNDRFVESEYYFFIIIQFNLFIQKKNDKHKHSHLKGERYLWISR